MIPYIPKKRETPKTITFKESAWGDIPTILKDIINTFGVETKTAVEFGVEYGYSTSALANYFDSVIGVDTFTGDIHAGFKGDIFEQTKKYLEGYDNIKLVKSSYQDFIKNNNTKYNFAHVDIVHTYEDTYRCGEWCVNNADVTIFHDTISFPEIFQSCIDLSQKYNLSFYNYQYSYGLGILVKQ